MKLPLAFGLLSMLPLCAGAAPVSSSHAAQVATLAGAQQGLAFGGFFTLYRFVVAGPLPLAERGGPMLDLPAPDEPEVGHPPAETLTFDLDPVADESAPPPTRPVKPRKPVFVLADNAEADPLGRMPLPGLVDPLRPYGPVLVASAIEVPEPSTLLLAALAMLALLTVQASPATGASRRTATGRRR